MTAGLHTPAGHPGLTGKEGLRLRGQKQQSRAGRAAEMCPGGGTAEMCPGGGQEEGQEGGQEGGQALTSFSDVPHRLQDLHSMHCQR